MLSDLARFCNIGFAFGLQSDAQMVFGVECQRAVFWYVHQMVFRNATPKKAPSQDFTIDPFKGILE